LNKSTGDGDLRWLIGGEVAAVEKTSTKGWFFWDGEGEVAKAVKSLMEELLWVFRVEVKSSAGKVLLRGVVLILVLDGPNGSNDSELFVEEDDAKISLDGKLEVLGAVSSKPKGSNGDDAAGG